MNNLVFIGALKANDEIRLALAKWAKIPEIKFKGKGQVYNFSVAENHNYFVGDSRLLTHNAGCWDTSVNWAKKDIDKLKDELRRAYSGFEDGRHNKYPQAMADRLKNMIDQGKKDGVLAEYLEQLEKTRKTFLDRAFSGKHRGGFSGR